MINKLKVLGFALMAALSMSALGASGASAAEIHSESANTTITGKQTVQNVFVWPAGNLKCEFATFKSTNTAATTSTITVTPAYEKCTLAGAAATIHINGCTYTFNAPVAVEAPTKYEGTVTLDCPAGQSITVTAPTCEIHIKPQGPLSKLEYHNTGTGTTREVDVTANIQNIHLVDTGTECLGNGGAKEKTFTTGKLTGTVLATGEVTGTKTHTGIWIA